MLVMVRAGGVSAAGCRRAVQRLSGQRGGCDYENEGESWAGGRPRALLMSVFGIRWCW
jgi:hypothetical protein